MRLSDQSISILKNLDNPEFMALEEIRAKMAQTLAETSVKKATEWETLWAVAEREAKMQGIIEFLQIVFNPER